MPCMAEAHHRHLQLQPGGSHAARSVGVRRWPPWGSPADRPALLLSNILSNPTPTSTATQHLCTHTQQSLKSKATPWTKLAKYKMLHTNDNLALQLTIVHHHVCTDSYQRHKSTNSHHTRNRSVRYQNSANVHFFAPSSAAWPAGLFPRSVTVQKAYGMFNCHDQRSPHLSVSLSLGLLLLLMELMMLRTTPTSSEATIAKAKICKQQQQHSQCMHKRGMWSH